MATELIVFDFFGVVCSEVAPVWLNKYFSEEEAARIQEEIVLAADYGRITQDELFTTLGEMAGFSPEAAENEWRSYVKINDAVVELIGKLRNLGLDTALLSNAPSPFLRNVLEKYQLEDQFKTIIISAEVESAKPDQDIYHKLLSRTAYKASQAVFIDDRAENIRGAKAVGMKGIHFKSVDDLMDKLTKLNVFDKR